MVSYDAATNRVTQAVDSREASPRSFAYDTRGNVTDNGPVTLAFDWANQPVAMTGTGISNTYTYDGNLKRVKSVQNGKTTYWVYSALTGTPVYADEVTDNIQTHYFSGGGTSIRIKNGNPEYTYSDHQGSPMITTNASAGVLWWEDYTPYGEKRLDPAANRNDIGYTGHVQDDASGLTYMQARYYDPVIGRFLSTDPIGYQDQLNLYAYVHNDPVNNIDPTGMCTGSRIKNDSGDCSFSGGSTTGAAGIAQGIARDRALVEAATNTANARAAGVLGAPGAQVGASRVGSLFLLEHSNNDPSSSEDDASLVDYPTMDNFGMSACNQGFYGCIALGDTFREMYGDMEMQIWTHESCVQGLMQCTTGSELIQLSPIHTHGYYIWFQVGTVMMNKGQPDVFIRDWEPPENWINSLGN